MRSFIALMLLVMAVSGIAVAQEGRSFEGVTKMDTVIGHLGIFDSLRGVYSKWEITTSGDTVEVSVPGLLGIDAGDGLVLSGPLTATGTVDLGGATDTLTWICLSPADTVRAIIIDGSIRLVDLP